METIVRKVIMMFLLLFVVMVGIDIVHMSRTDSRPDSTAFALQQFDLDQMAELRRMIKEEIGDARATNLTQCRSIAFGDKPCGGPASYLASSVAKTDEAKLKALVDDYNQQSKNYNIARKVLSDCMYVSAPKIELVEGVCKLEWNKPVPIK
jgi:hypothetical protein